MAIVRRTHVSVRRPHRLRRSIVAAASALAIAGGLLTAATGTAVAATAPSPPNCGLQIYKVDGSPWTCTFVDNFSGTVLDSSKWLVGQTTTTGFTVGNTCFEPSNVTLAGGFLNLTAKDKGAAFTCQSPFGPFTTRYTGAHVGTNGRFAQTYGKFEVRARYPSSGPGLHGGFWLYPAKQTYGPWPASGEIDVAEWWSSVPLSVLPTLHYNTSTFLDDSGWLCTVVDPTAWHTYSVVWAQTLMQFSIDNKPCFTRSWTPDPPLVAPQPFDHPFNMVLNMAVDTTSATNFVTPLTILPATYQVDYAKAWR